MSVELVVGHELTRGIARPAVTGHGRLVGTPQYLLGWLETSLGRELPEVSFTSRMLEYLRCLQECDGPGRFYHRSLQQDELGVARELLLWRDRWYEACWNGGAFGGAVSARLSDMAAVEALAAERVAFGVGQRVLRVIDALGDGVPDISITLVDPLETFAACWRRLFEACGAQVHPWQPSANADPDTDLGRLQSALLNGSGANEPIELTGDGTFVVLRDGSPQLSSHWVARYAQGYVDRHGDATAAVLADSRGSAFDEGRAEADMPRLGFNEPSWWRPVFQVLPLALEMLWQPLDPLVLLQFLSHPVGPLPARVRASLARIAADQPGIGGEKWCEAVAECVAEAIANAEPEQGERVGEELSNKISLWLDNERFAPDAGASTDAILARTNRVTDWLASAATYIDDDARAGLYRIAMNQAHELIGAVERLSESGTARIPRDSLRRLVEAVRGNGSPRPDLARECRDGEPQLLRADAPAGVLEPTPLVVWFGCDEAHLPRAYPWSRREQDELRAHGVELVALDTQLEWQAQSWLRPILSATGQLVLVLHDDAEGHHPVFDQVQAVATGWPEHRIDELIRAGGESLSGQALPPVEALDRRTLPGVLRWWQLDSAEGLEPRDVESYSSLAKFLYGPYQWVLDYKGRVRAGALAEIDDGNRLKGTLVHHLFEQYFNEHPDIASLDADDARAWAEAQLPGLLETCGAVLLAPGRQTEKEDFVDTTTNALAQLIRHLQSAGVVNVAMESGWQGRFAGGELSGIIDVYATNAEGQTAVVDIKWSGYRYRRSSFQDSDYLQLAVYAWLCKQVEGSWPTLAFFVITDARMVVLDSPYFPDAEQILPANEENVAQFWQRAETTWRWRRAQLDAGLIEVPVSSTEPEDTSTPGEDGLPMPETYDRFSDFNVLTGWEPQS